LLRPVSPACSSAGGCARGLAVTALDGAQRPIPAVARARSCLYGETTMMPAIDTVGLCLPDDGSRRQPWRIKRRRDGALVLVVCNSRGSWARPEAEAIAAGALAGALSFGSGDPRADMAPAMECAAEEMRDQASEPDWWGPVCEAIACVVEPGRVTIGWVGRCAAVLRGARGVRARTMPYGKDVSLRADEGPGDASTDAGPRSLQVAEDGSIEPVRPAVESWPGMDPGDRMVLGTRLVAARFAGRGADGLGLRALLDETNDELRRDPVRAGSDGLVAVLASRRGGTTGWASPA
jgi:hypothetical protein